MRQLTVISLVLLVSYPLFLKVGILGYWQYNRAYIAKTLCDFKDVKDSPCQGKCYLMKKIKGIDTHSKEDFNFPLNILKSTDTECLLPAGFRSSWLITLKDISSQTITTITHYSISLIVSIFQPPEL